MLTPMGNLTSLALVGSNGRHSLREVGCGEEYATLRRLLGGMVDSLSGFVRFMMR